MKSLQVGDLRAEIKILHCLQFGEIRAFLIFLLHAPSTLANCYHMRSVRQQIATVCATCTNKLRTQFYMILHNFTPFATACAVCASNFLPDVQCALAIGYRMRSVRQQFATICSVYANKADHMLILPIYLNQVLTYE